MAWQGSLGSCLYLEFLYFVHHGLGSGQSFWLFKFLHQYIIHLVYWNFGHRLKFCAGSDAVFASPIAQAANYALASKVSKTHHLVEEAQFSGACLSSLLLLHWTPVNPPSPYSCILYSSPVLPEWPSISKLPLDPRLSLRTFSMVHLILTPSPRGTSWSHAPQSAMSGQVLQPGRNCPPIPVQPSTGHFVSAHDSL